MAAILLVGDGLSAERWPGATCQHKVCKWRAINQANFHEKKILS
ncbi:hypothetical protein [Acuticoccus sediminis]|nr:hypothetical protein [Acuticoccus sediminis]